MMGTTELKYTPDPVLERALEVLFILHADHEQNCSTSTVRVAGSSRVDPYSAVAAGVGALYGPLHGGANEQVLRMLEEIGSVDRVPAYIERVRSGELRLMGFGHRVYKSYDPRGTADQRVADQVFGDRPQSPARHCAGAREDRARGRLLHHHKLYPNVDFYSGSSTRRWASRGHVPGALRDRTMPGWLAQWEEGLLGPRTEIARPRQLYTRTSERHLERV